VLDQELQKTLAQRENAARQARLRSSLLSKGATHATNSHQPDDLDDADKENVSITNALDSKAQRRQQQLSAVKRDFFGRVIVERPLVETDGNAAGTGGKGRRRRAGDDEEAKVWVTYHEGLNNAVRKPISLEEFLRGF
jgi:chromosome transmission fidelity protein 18